MLLKRPDNIPATASGSFSIQTIHSWFRHAHFSRRVTLLTLDLVRDRLRGRIPAQITDPGARQAAVALVLAPESDDLKALLIRRATRTDDPWSGHVALPGGRRDAEDGDLFVTAVRETLEETGVRLSSADQLGQWDDLAPRTPVLPNIIIRPFVFGLEKTPEVHPSPEVAYHLWVPLGRLKEASGRATVDIRGNPTEVSAFVLGRAVIWGLTERILKSVIDLLA